MSSRLTLLHAALALGGCFVIGSCGGSDPSIPDAGQADAGPPIPPSIAHCETQPVPPTARAGGTVESGALSAGTAERLLDIPLGSSLAAYTSRAESVGREGFLPQPDDRHTYLAGSFAPSVGVETAPRLRGLALSAGGETVVILKIDLASSYQGFVHDVEERLGPDYSGKVIIASSHSHSSYGNYSGHSALHAGFGRFRSTVYERLIDEMEQTARDAIAALEPAQIGFAYDPDFDPEDRVNSDRRSENDEIAGGSFDDHHLFVVRVDNAAGEPMALLPTFGIHGIVHGGSNVLLSTDSIGGIERVLEERFDSEVLVMHLQGAGGDVSPRGSSTTDCMGDELCSDYGRAETIGLYAAESILAAWTSAGETMQTELEMEMVTRTVPLGPNWENFTIRGGALEYAPWDGRTEADGVVYDESGAIISPIDEFNAPYGGALCGAGGDLGLRLPRSKLPGTDELRDLSYFYCNQLEKIDEIIELTVDVDFEEPPICGTTQTTVSALRLGDWMMVTLPGEPVTLTAEYLRTLSPVPEEQTIVVGYAQDHGGYLLLPEDWLVGGYEPSITFWGPLEGEYVVEQAAAVMALAATAEREDGNAGGIERNITPTQTDSVMVDASGITPGTVPEEMPAYILARRIVEVPGPQPAAEVARLETVYFTWVGDDPLQGMARPYLQREVERDGSMVFEDVRRRSGRPVVDGDLILTWTPDPINREDGITRNHYYTVEFQAAAPMGMPDLEQLDQRRGLPLGRYRFRIEGPTYEVVSAPFTVTPATLQVSSEVAGGDLRITVGMEARNGFRVLDLQTRSNGFVPLRDQTLEVSWTSGGAPTVETVTTDDGGMVTLGGAAGATEVTLTDTYGNTTTFTP